MHHKIRFRRGRCLHRPDRLFPAPPAGHTGPALQNVWGTHVSRRNRDIRIRPNRKAPSVEGKGGKMKKYVIRGRKLLTNGREHGIIILVLARLAQLVEHMLDVHGVTGSSPVPRTIVKSSGISWVPGFFVILPKYAFLDFSQMPLKVAKIAFFPGLCPGKKGGRP